MGGIPILFVCISGCQPNNTFAYPSGRPRVIFVYSKPDCRDGSDEVPCTVSTDPNAADRCDPSNCVLPDCFCSVDGTKVPGDLEVAQVPQMITLSFNGAVNYDNIPIYDQLFSDGNNTLTYRLVTSI